MNAPKSLFLALAIIVAGASFADAQTTIDLRPQPSANVAAEADSDLVNEIFGPITNQLNLTAAQKFRITNIASAVVLQADPLFNQLDALENRLSVAAFSGQLDEAAIKLVSDQQAALLGQIISIKARARNSFYRVLSAEQRAFVADRIRARIAEENLGSISN